MKQLGFITMDTMKVVNPFGVIKKLDVQKTSGLESMGWFMCSLVETANVMDESMYFEYRYLQSLLKDAADALIQYQDKFWYVLFK